MKISAIEISDFYQFKNLKIDLTYPKGHAKAGQPLDKVCIIGQNGTGKTTILKFIHNCFIEFQKFSLNKLFMSFEKDTHIKINDVDYDFQTNGAILTRSVFPVDNEFNTRTIFAEKLIYIPTNSYTHINDPVGYDKRDYKTYFQLSADNTSFIDTIRYATVLKYNIDLVNFSLSLFNSLREGKNIDMKAEQELWDKNNPNPLQEIAAFVDKLLKPTGLKLKTKLDNSFNAVDIQLVSLKNGETVPFDQLSSGTKNIFWTAWALYQQIENESIILIDEPENSLYPNLQREIVPTYTSLRPEAETQFFFATHSPVIASCFEPWEIVDLELDDDNHVFRHLYYEGENHVDNYTIYPQYLRWDSIMNKVFDIKDTEGGELRRANLEEWAAIKGLLDLWKSEGKTAKEDPEMRIELEKYKKLLIKLF